MIVDLAAKSWDPMQLTPAQRERFWRAYWHERVIGGRDERTAELSAMVVATDEFADDAATAQGERMWWRERGAAL